MVQVVGVVSLGLVTRGGMEQLEREAERLGEVRGVLLCPYAAP